LALVSWIDPREDVIGSRGVDSVKILPGKWEHGGDVSGRWPDKTVPGSELKFMLGSSKNPRSSMYIFDAAERTAVTAE
jgi:hypothetical protein